jgi:hypothetical protein
MKLILLTAALYITVTSHSQTWEEWTEQNKTQRKYLIEQNAALQTFLAYLKEGYQIAHTGISTIQNITCFESNLHKEFFESLRRVNPVIRKHWQVAQIISLQVQMLRLSSALVKESKDEHSLNESELEYVEATCDRLVTESVNEIDQVLKVLKPGELEMKDEDRIKRVQLLYQSILHKSIFLSSFSASINAVRKQRQHEQVEEMLSQKINKSRY